MINLISSELLKQKKSFARKIVFTLPILNFLLMLLLMGPKYLQASSYNWWYILFLPFLLTYIAAWSVRQEKKHNYHGMFAVVQKKRSIWYAKIATVMISMVVATVIFGIITFIGGEIFVQHISLLNQLFACCVILITLAWQIPLFMLITLKTNIFLSVFLSAVSNIILACLLAVKSTWWIPFAIPARLMCPIAHILPNGLIMEANDPLGNANVIWPGIAITVALFIVVSVLTAKIFERQEA